MRTIPTTLAVLALWAPIAAAQTGLDPVIKTLRENGYRSIEVEREGNRIKVEARRGGQERELVYDARNGRLISDESSARSGGIGALFGGDRTGARVRDDDDDDRGGRTSRGGTRNDDDDDDDDDGGSRGGGGGGGRDDDDDDDGGSRGGGGGGGRDDDDDDGGSGGNSGGSSGGGRGGGNDSDDDSDDDDD